MLKTWSNNVILKCWAKQITTTTTDVIADQNQTYIEWWMSPWMSSIQSYIYNIQQQLYLLWNLWRGVRNMVYKPYTIFQTLWMHEWDWVIKTLWDSKDHGLDNSLSWKIQKKASTFWWKKFPLFVLIQTLFVLKNWPDFQVSLKTTFLLTNVKKYLSWYGLWLSAPIHIKRCRTKWIYFLL